MESLLCHLRGQEMRGTELVVCALTPTTSVQVCRLTALLSTVRKVSELDPSGGGEEPRGLVC